MITRWVNGNDKTVALYLSHDGENVSLMFSGDGRGAEVLVTPTTSLQISAALAAMARELGGAGDATPEPGSSNAAPSVAERYVPSRDGTYGIRDEIERAERLVGGANGTAAEREAARALISVSHDVIEYQARIAKAMAACEVTLMTSFADPSGYISAVRRILWALRGM